MQIETGATSFNVWRNYTSNVNNLRDSMARLSSGNRINSAGDDPSGLAMSERLSAQARNTGAASGNVQNRLNYLQTADSWMQKMHDILGRMGELAVSANDDTKSDTDKGILQTEFQHMQDELSRITDDAAKFNNILLFEGTSVDLQIGPDGNQVFTSGSVDLDSTDNTITTDGSLLWNDLLDGTGAAAPVDISATGDAGAAVTAVNAGIDFISIKRSDIGAEMKRMEQTLDGLSAYEENIFASESKIRDVDVAKETVRMSRFSILQQVGIAMFAQANQISQGVLRLVQ